jgi:hypothetical protein
VNGHKEVLQIEVIVFPAEEEWTKEYFKYGWFIIKG